MKIYITTGTVDYLSGLKGMHPSETMVYMGNQVNALLLHETDGVPVFKQPRNYEVIEAVGIFPEKGFVVMHNIPVKEESRPLFEHQIKGLPAWIEQKQGFIALRILRPLSSPTYIIVTVWEKENSFENQKDHLDSQIKNISENGNDSQTKIFSSAPYKSKYTILEDNEQS